LKKPFNLQKLSSFKNNNKDLQPSKTRIKNFQPSKTKIRTFNLQEQEPSTPKNINKNLQLLSFLNLKKPYDNLSILFLK